MFKERRFELPITKDPVYMKIDEKSQFKSEAEGKEEYFWFSDKLLIITGLVLTISIIFLEFLLPDSPTTGFIMLALATPAQILLGRPFYYRFFQTLKYRKRFTTDTLVVLSTSVAYLYSLFTLLFTSSHIQFFEASTSVLTIFTIGEYLERKVLKRTLLTGQERQIQIRFNGFVNYPTRSL